MKCLQQNCNQPQILESDFKEQVTVQPVSGAKLIQVIAGNSMDKLQYGKVAMFQRTVPSFTEECAEDEHKNTI